MLKVIPQVLKHHGNIFHSTYQNLKKFNVNFKYFSTSLIQNNDYQLDSGHLILSNKSLISINGIDSTKFLNGLITNKVPFEPQLEFEDINGTENESKMGFFTAFLNAKGKLLCDSFIYPNVKNSNNDMDLKEYFIEIDSGICSNLLSVLKLHKLRSKVNIKRIPNENDIKKEQENEQENEGTLKTLYLYNDEMEGANSKFIEFIMKDIINKEDQNQNIINGISIDDRAIAFGIKILTKKTSNELFLYLESKISQLTDKSEEEINLLKEILNSYKDQSTSITYKIRRYLEGIPEGINELIPLNYFPMEMCFDYLDAINFNKGCYIGQELTIRTHHTGVVRKRIIPLLFYQIPSNSDSETKTALDDNVDELNLEYHEHSPIAEKISDIVTGEKILIDEDASLKEPEDELESVITPEQTPSPFGSSRPVKRRRKSNTSVGIVIAKHGDIGLGLVRLEKFSVPGIRFKIEVPNVNNGQSEKVGVKGYIPYWWPNA